MSDTIFGGRKDVRSGFPISGSAKPGVFQPVTGQAVITQTTCVDDLGAKEAAKNKDGNTHYAQSRTANVGQRVESHLLALKKIEGGGISKRRFRNQRGSGASLKIFTFLNGREKKDKNFNELYEHVGVVQVK